jgi:hypothetical protein
VVTVLGTLNNDVNDRKLQWLCPLMPGHNDEDEFE